MKMLITGGLGLIVPGLLSYLKKHYEIRLSHWREPEASLEYEFVKCDVTKLDEVEKAVEGIDVILNLAARGAQGPNEVSFQDAIGVNVIGVLNLLEASQKFKIKKFIHCSSLWVYGLPGEGTIPEYFPIDEAHPAKPKSPYGVTKLMAEDLLEGFSRNADFPVFVFRVGAVMRPDYTCSDMTSESLYAYFQYIDVRDVAMAMSLAIESDLKGFNTYNLVAGDSSCYGTKPTIELLKENYPDVKIKDIEYFRANKYRSMISSEKLRKELGFKEEYPLERLYSWIKSGKNEVEYYGILKK